GDRGGRRDRGRRCGRRLGRYLTLLLGRATIAGLATITGLLLLGLATTDRGIVATIILGGVTSVIVAALQLGRPTVTFVLSGAVSGAVVRTRVVTVGRLELGLQFGDLGLQVLRRGIVGTARRQGQNPNRSDN
ncbi:MAG: hypothetical protein ACPG7T_07155, partial [Ilumatobacteraceae bacterium]